MHHDGTIPGPRNLFEFARAKRNSANGTMDIATYTPKLCNVSFYEKFQKGEGEWWNHPESESENIRNQSEI